MKRWYHAEYKDEEVNIFAENGEFFIPLESEKVLDLFGYLTTKFENLALIEEVNQDFLAAAHSERNLKKKRKNVPKKKKVAYSYQTVRLFKSALVWYHGKEHFPKELDDALEKLLKGYK